MVLTRRGVLSASVLCIVGVIIVPLLVNFISNDLYPILQSWLAMRMRLLIWIMMLILCVLALIMEVIHDKDRKWFLRLFKETRLLLPLFKVFKCRSYPKITQCTSFGFKRPYDPLRNDPEVLIVRKMLDSCREEGSRIQSLVQIHMALKIHKEQQVPDVEAALPSEYTTKGSRVLHRRFEIGPQTGNVDLDVLSVQIAEAMRRAQEIDKNCTFQFGSFAFLKYTDGELKCWRLQEHWTPVIYDIRRSPWNIITGQRSKWIIRGSNLPEATLKASTSDEKEEMTILHRHKMENGDDELWCAEPGLIWRSALMFWKGVYICAVNSVNERNEGLTFDLQSESKNVTRAYWMSVAEGFIPSPRTMMIIIVNLCVLGSVTNGTHSGIGSQLGSYYLGLLKITDYGPNFEILLKPLNMLQVLFFLIEFIFACWWFMAYLSPPSGCPLPQQTGRPDSEHGRSPDLPITNAPDLAGVAGVRSDSSFLFKKQKENDPDLLMDCVVGEIDKARVEVWAQEEFVKKYLKGKGSIDVLLQDYAIWRKNDLDRTASPEPDAQDDFVSWWYEKVAKETQQVQATLNAAANAILVIAALVASASFVGPLQPLGYDGGSIQVNNVAVRAFVVCDSVAFFLALAAIMLALVPSLPLPKVSKSTQLRRTKIILAVSVTFLFPSIICVLVAFAAGCIAANPGLAHHGLAVATPVVGGFLVLLATVCFLIRIVGLKVIKPLMLERARGEARTRAKVEAEEEDELNAEDEAEDEGDAKVEAEARAQAEDEYEDEAQPRAPVMPG